MWVDLACFCSESLRDGDGGAIMTAMTTSAGAHDDQAPWWTTIGEVGDLQSQELRIAASFSGGVSLAIWMSGLTYELDRLLRSSDAERSERCVHPEREPEERDNHLQPRQTQHTGPSEQSSPSQSIGSPQPSEQVEPADSRYAALLRLLRIDVDVDVVTGTSAGGINGVALALARTRGCRCSHCVESGLELARSPNCFDRSTSPSRCQCCGGMASC